MMTFSAKWPHWSYTGGNFTSSTSPPTSPTGVSPHNDDDGLLSLWARRKSRSWLEQRPGAAASSYSGLHGGRRKLKSLENQRRRRRGRRHRTSTRSCFYVDDMHTVDTTQKKLKSCFVVSMRTNKAKGLLNWLLWALLQKGVPASSPFHESDWRYRFFKGDARREVETLEIAVVHYHTQEETNQ